MRRKANGKPRQKVFLGEWEEYVGFLRGIEEGPRGRVAMFDDAAVALCGELDDLKQHIGKRVGILRTDDVERPMCVRVILDS